MLGSVEVWSGETSVPLGGAKPKALLALLMLERGHVVATHRLIDIIWGEDPPETVRSLIQVYVSTLRRNLADHGLPDVIVTQAPGYVLQVPAEAVDRDVFLRLVEQSRTVTGAQRVGLLRMALELWRGPALGGLEQAVLVSEALRLEQQRLSATEERIAAELELGLHDQLVGELARLVAQHPANERLRGQFMLALQRQGKQADALATFRECREHLAQELGLDPGPELVALHEGILRGDLQQRQHRVPTQLPRVPDDFTGRSEEITVLTRPGRSRLQIIAGQGGCGKSALAAHVARSLASWYPDGQLHAELRGMSDNPAEPAEVLARFLRALGVEAGRIPESTVERAELFRGLLEGRRVLILLDDARNLAQIQPLIPATPQSSVLITSRDRLTGLAGAQLTELGVLAAGEAIELLSHVVGEQRVRQDLDAARQIVGHCGGLPLAIRIAGARLASRGRLPLSWLADRLADETRRLDELSIQDMGVRASIELSHQALDSVSKLALGRIGFFGVPDFAAWTVGWLTGVSEADAEDVIERLVDAQLVEFSGVDRLGNLRYGLHDLVRIWARENAEATEPLEQLRASVTRVLIGWLSYVDRAAKETQPDDIRWRVTRDHGVVGPPLDDPRAWFEAEQICMVAGVERAAALGLHELACDFAPEQYSAVLSGANRFDTRARIIDAVLNAARTAGDLRIEAVMTAEMGQLRYLHDRFDESRLLFREALGRFRELGDERGQAATLAGLGAACRESGFLLEALHFLDQAVGLLRGLDDDIGIGYAQRLAGSVRLEAGDFSQALADLQEALSCYQRAGSRRGEALTLRTLGLFHRALGNYAESIELCGRSRQIFSDLGDELLEAFAVRAMCKARFRLDPSDDVREELEWALEVSRTMEDRWGQGATLRVLGEWYLARGELDQAEAQLIAAREVLSVLEAPLWTARTEHDLSLVYAAQGRTDLSAELESRALSAFHDRNAREYAELTGTKPSG
ncbi:DNA-binding SARP family transcriptional activator/tetratricopeptide (TPR) repeat protein [Allocatelliglobosispora scoriae]|uniref:DNA-binding SARP family transcriptional activator/tetratricopeptide (TPR) repeat protein n=1 Tax=Allocatelliglobosispora scoriae TaxID=643052 RepID=A0A841BIM1_9ACTN|nr:BTAD domain-containing putative transcriptional regulator [Allocatelliglobosispora scoriae]MBB5867455.1 DNA-binding SARP family transcriptional activator/tetratricopeptide (TPR) repeat protein [Allocatelliglobosispora scoriae]